MTKRRTYRKPHRYKSKKPISRQPVLRLGILVFIFFVSLFYFLFFTPPFQVKTVSVTGQEKIAKEDIESFIPKKNIFLVDTAKISKDILSQFPQIAGVEVSRGFFDAVNIVVRERQGAACWVKEDRYFLVDDQGIIFEEMAEMKPGLISIKTAETGLPKLGERVIEKEQLSQVFEIKSKLKESAGLSVKEAFLESADRLNLKTSEGWDIYFNLKGDLGWQLTELALVLEKQISPDRREALEYVDLRFSRVYYK